MRLLLYIPSSVRAAGKRAKAFARRRRAALSAANDIAAYLSSHPVASLHLGAGGNRLEGWLNTDIDTQGCVPLDATKPFPVPDVSFDYVYSEHMIEHVPWAAGQHMLRESFRVLKPGGRVRVATPDLKKLCKTVACGGDEELVGAYADAILPDAHGHKAVFLVNQEFRAWGHQFLYDEGLLAQSMTDAGFTEVRRYAVGQSDEPPLRGVERHGQAMGAGMVAVVEHFTLVLEAVRPLLNLSTTTSHLGI